MDNNVFLRPLEYYRRELSPLHDYMEQSSFYMSKMTGKTKAECRMELGRRIRNKEFPKVRDPRVNYYQRDENMDRHQVQGTLNGYIRDINQSDEILAPTFTTYVKPYVRKSLLVEFIDTNKNKRAQFRREASTARTEGNMSLYEIKNNDQNNMKIYNNSMSGTFSAGGTPLNNPTGHNTLTTIVRTMSSISNASNEKIISGNRHYYNPKVTLNNINYIASSVEREELQAVINKYNLHVPTVEEVKSCIRYSTELYMNDGRLLNDVWKLVEKLDDLERAAVVYGGDFYHLRIYNESFVRDFINELSDKRTDIRYEDPLERMKGFDPMTINYAHQVCMEELKGKGKHYHLLSEEHLNTLVYVCENIEKTVVKYKDLIDVIFLTRNIPASTAHIRSMVRRTVVLSDTDSTMFSIDEWVNWYYGEIIFSPDAYAKAGAVMYIATQCMAHNLALMSANMGVEKEKMFDCAMKPEYVFGPHFQTPVAKHYFCPVLVENGDVFPEMDMEIKGVNLISSAVSRRLIQNSHEHMRWLSTEIMSNRKISIDEQLTRVANIEREIINGILSGDTQYFRTGQVKPADSYKQDETRSNYRHHIHWRDVWAPKYGFNEEPPYSIVAIPLKTDKISTLRPWVESIEDEALRTRMVTWLNTNQRRNLTTVYFPHDVVTSTGIPEELKSAINIKKIVLDGTRSERMILSTLGYFIKTDWLISDTGY